MPTPRHARMPGGSEAQENNGVSTPVEAGPVGGSVSVPNSGVGGTDGDEVGRGDNGHIHTSHQDKQRKRRAAIPKLTKLAPKDHGPAEDKWEHKHPALGELMYRGSWNDIDPRAPAKLKIVARAGMVQIVIECPTEGYKCTAVGETFEKAFATLEWYCANGVGPWEELGWGTGNQRRKDLRRKELDKLRTINDDSD